MGKIGLWMSLRLDSGQNRDWTRNNNGPSNLWTVGGTNKSLVVLLQIKTGKVMVFSYGLQIVLFVCMNPFHFKVII
jgi:hypothetical protein